MNTKTICAYLAAASFGAFIAHTASAAAMDDALNSIKGYKFGDSRSSLANIEGQVTGSLGNPAERTAWANALAGLLSSADATKDCKDFACRQLVLCAGPEQVPAIAELLKSAESADMARYALTNIPGEEVDKALVAALKKADDKAKPGIVATLGDRGSEEAVKPLGNLVNSKDAVLAESAINALGRIGGAKAAKALAGAHKKSANPSAVAHARIRCAERCAEMGDAKCAKEIYAALENSEEESVSRAAKIGLAHLSSNTQ